MQLLIINLHDKTPSEPQEVPPQPSVEAIIEYGRTASENGLMVFMGPRVKAECINERLLQPEYQLFAFDGVVLDHIIE